jgi:hypothetical protein
MVEQKDWKWFGFSGHFICGRWCRFHMCTQVGEYLVSTVGAYVHPSKSGGSERIEAEWLKDNWPGEEVGAGRKYETMVFAAGSPCTEPDCNCGQPRLKDPSELDFAGCNTAREATENHMRMCTKYANISSDADTPEIVSNTP